MEPAEGPVQKERISIRLSNFWKPRSRKIKRISLALRSFVGSISMQQYIAEKADIAFWILTSGFAIDLFMEFIEIATDDRRSE